MTYHTEERATRKFEILVNALHVGEQTVERYRPGSSSGRFFDVAYAIPSELVRDEQKVTVRFQASAGSETAAVYAVRITRSDAER